jgi:hypothetical protein
MPLDELAMLHYAFRRLYATLLRWQAVYFDDCFLPRRPISGLQLDLLACLFLCHASSLHLGAVGWRMLLNILFEILPVVLQPLEYLLDYDPRSDSAGLQQVLRSDSDEGQSIEALLSDYIINSVHEKLLSVSMLLAVNHFSTSRSVQSSTFLGI